ncbi:MAG: alpha/beta hydrolase family protein [Pseudomonadales bacterium]
MKLSIDHSHHFELLRILGHAYYGGSDVQEVLQIAGRLTPGDDEGWYEAWNALAESLKATADEAQEKGHLKSASQTYLRAAMYFMISDFYLHANTDDPRILASGRASRAAFMAAIPGLDFEVARVEIPYEGAWLPGYVVKKKGTPAGKRPTLICHSGFDGNKEELVLFPGMAAAERGYTVVAFDGPGQGEVVRETRRAFRPDWDKVVSPVIDFALTRADVDPSRIALLGISLGGVLAPIAAAKDRRIRALVANGGLYSFYDVVSARFPEAVPANRERFDQAVNAAIKTDTMSRWAINHGKLVFGVDNAFDYVNSTKPYVAADAAQVRATTLVIDSEQEGFFEGQPQKLYDALTCEKTLMHFPSSEAVGEHCQAGAEAAGGRKIFDWLDEAMDVKSVKP